jgi:hypothetical protein
MVANFSIGCASPRVAPQLEQSSFCERSTNFNLCCHVRAIVFLLLFLLALAINFQDISRTDTELWASSEILRFI